MSLQHKTDLAKVAKGRLIAEYRNMPMFVALIGAIGDLIQIAEDAYWDLFNAMLLDNATGIWLEYLGAMIGEAREGWGNDDYRRFIKARILANKSSGTINEVLEIIALIINATDPTVAFLRAEEFYPASMLIEIAYPDWPTNDALRSRLVRIVSRARPTGVRLLINSTDDDTGGACFTFADLPMAPAITDVTMQDTIGGTLLGSHAYYYRLSALDAVGQTLASAEVSGTTDVGTNTNQLLISWAAVAGATGYKLYGRNTGAELLMATLGLVTSFIDNGSITPSGALPTIDTTAGQYDTSLGFNDIMPTPVISSIVAGSPLGGLLHALTAYYYRVSATDAYGESLASAEVGFTTAAGANTKNNVINWTAIPGATGYKVYGRTTGAELLIATVGAVIFFIDSGAVTPAGAIPASNTAAGNTGGIFISGDLA